MSNVSTLFQKPHVLIEAGRCTGSDDPGLIGSWLFMVVLVDDEGGHVTDYVGSGRDAADRAAVALARDFGCRIFDRSIEAPA